MGHQSVRRHGSYGNSEIETLDFMRADFKRVMGLEAFSAPHYDGNDNFPGCQFLIARVLIPDRPIKGQCRKQNKDDQS
jgi:hypothetical protein